MAPGRRPPPPRRDAINVSFAWQDPFFGFARFYDSPMVAPRSVNWGCIQDPEMDKLRPRARLVHPSRDIARRKLHERAVEESYFLSGATTSSARAVTQGEGLRAGEKLVPGFLHGSMTIDRTTRLPATWLSAVWS